VAPPAAESGFGLWQQLKSAVVFHFLRHFARWATLLPPHAPKLVAHHYEADPGNRSHAG